MKTAVQMILIFVVGIAGGVLGSSLLSGGAASGPAAPAGPDGELPAALLRALEERVMLLEREADAHNLAVEELDARVLAATRRVPTPEAAAALASGEGPDAGALGLASPTGPGFDAAVEAAIERREEAQRAEREAERAQRRDERVQRTVDELAAELGLDGGQKEVVAQAMKESIVAREAFFESMRETGNMDRDGARKAMAQIRAVELEKAGSVLNAQQLQRYTEVSDLGRDFGRGGQAGGQGGGRDGNARGGGF